MIGPGKYDDICTDVRERTQAQGVILAIIGGTKGEGFSVQGNLSALLAAPSALRAIADAIEADLP